MLQCYGYDRLPAAGPGLLRPGAQYSGLQPSYSLSSDGLTVYDKNTGLTWQRSPDTNGDGSLTKNDKLTLFQAQAYPATLNAEKFGGYSDWRLPTIKELYSLIEFTGPTPADIPGTDTSGLTPFIDTQYFSSRTGQTGTGERIIDSQYASSTKYVGPAMNGQQTLFGVNFADGRIKGYGLGMPGGQEKTFFVICVRGNPGYGTNQFIDNGDGTITDNATGLMWSRSDSGSGMDWEVALAWVQEKNAEKYLGYNDWRLPDAKELQSIVDYTRSPDTTGSAAIDQLFTCTQITSEAGQADYPFYWTGTTHAASNGMGGSAVYVSFGRAMGYVDGRWQDVHGAGAQRSDPKSGSASEYPQGHGPQGDAIRIDNYVRMVTGRRGYGHTGRRHNGRPSAACQARQPGDRGRRGHLPRQLLTRAHPVLRAHPASLSLPGDRLPAHAGRSGSNWPVCRDKKKGSLSRIAREGKVDEALERVRTEQFHPDLLAHPEAPLALDDPALGRREWRGGHNSPCRKPR